MDTITIDYFERVKAILKETGIVESEITPDADLSKDLGMDSLDLADLVMRMEIEFHLTINDSEAQELKTIVDVVNYLELHSS